jgi:hypothetical protein
MSDRWLTYTMAVTTAISLIALTDGWLAVAVDLAAVAAMESTPQAPEQYPGQHEHARPPEDFYCSDHPNAPKDHACACQRKCSKPLDDEGNEIPGPLVEGEDPKCSVYCHKDKCSCSTKCGQT